MCFLWTCLYFWVYLGLVALPVCLFNMPCGHMFVVVLSRSLVSLCTSWCACVCVWCGPGFPETSGPESFSRRGASHTWGIINTPVADQPHLKGLLNRGAELQLMWEFCEKPRQVPASLWQCLGSLIVACTNSNLLLFPEGCGNEWKKCSAVGTIGRRLTHHRQWEATAREAWIWLFASLSCFTVNKHTELYTGSPVFGSCFHIVDKESS